MAFSKLGRLEQGDVFHSAKGWNPCLDCSKDSGRGPWLKSYSNILKRPDEPSLHIAVIIYMRIHPLITNYDQAREDVIKNHPRSFMWKVIVNTHPAPCVPSGGMVAFLGGRH